MPDLVINEDEILFDDEAAATGADSDVNGVFTDYKVKNHYEHDLHRYMLGVTDPEPSYRPGQGISTRSRDGCAVVQLARPTMVLVVEWTALKLGKEPQIPDPLAVDSDWVLLDVIPSTAMISVTPSGEPRYRVEGSYIYCKKRPSAKPFDDVRFPLAPWLEDVFARRVEADRLQGNIAVPQVRGNAGPLR